ncbi:MAG: acylneuraminate cytidylyltransferase family protein [Candidatus Rokubacteria bacterium]|nr:acylneuraminate cytidylyltransferase family protein [Candidatus Rokubacteria bacterium]
MTVLALIPARGGSKSVPRKNLRLLAGKPLIAHSIRHAQRSACITRVMVSTDDAEIADVARAWGAEVPFLRPAELALDSTPDVPVFEHALRWLEHHEDYVPDVVVHLRATAPIRRVETVDRAITDFLARPDVDSLRSVSLAEQTPFKMWFITGDSCLEPVVGLPSHREAYNLPRQTLPRAYWQNGYVDITRPAVVKTGSMTGTRILSFIIDEPCVEIDYEDHFEAAELLLRGTGRTQQSTGEERFPS